MPRTSKCRQRLMRFMEGAAKDGIVEGFGIEDLARITGYMPDTVAKIIRDMDREGVLERRPGGGRGNKSTYTLGWVR